MENSDRVNMKAWKTEDNHYLLFTLSSPIRYNTAAIVIPGFPVIEESHGFVLLDQYGKLLRQFEAHREESFEDYMYTIDIYRVLGNQLLCINFNHKYGAENSQLEVEVILNYLREVPNPPFPASLSEKLMTQQELIDALDHLGWPKHSYYFNSIGPGAHNVDVLVQHDGEWSLYYYERGQARLIQQFDSEAALYRHYLNHVLQQLEQPKKNQSQTEQEIWDIIIQSPQSQAQQQTKDEWAKTIRQQAIAIALEGEESVKIEDLKAWTNAQENFHQNQVERLCKIAVAQYSIDEQDNAIATLSRALQKTEQIQDIYYRYSRYRELAQIQTGWGCVEDAKQTFCLARQTILPLKPARYRWMNLRYLATDQFKAGLPEDTEATMGLIKNDQERLLTEAEIQKLKEPPLPKPASKPSPPELVLQTLRQQAGDWGIENALQQVQSIREPWFRCEAFCYIAQEQWQRGQLEAAQDTFKLARKTVFQINIYDKGYVSGSVRKGVISMSYSMALIGQAQAEVGAIEAAKATFAEATRVEFGGMNAAREFGWKSYYEPDPLIERLIHIAEVQGRLGWPEAESTFQQAIHLAEETDFGGAPDEVLDSMYKYLREIAEAQARVGYLLQAQQTAQSITNERQKRDAALSCIVDQAVLHHELEIALNIATTIKDYIYRFNSLIAIALKH